MNLGGFTLDTNPVYDALSYSIHRANVHGGAGIHEYVVEKTDVMYFYIWCGFVANFIINPYIHNTKCSGT